MTTKERRAEVLRRKRAGQSHAEIAAAMGMKYQIVTWDLNALRRRGVMVGDGRRNLQRLHAILDAKQAGLSSPQIAAAQGVAASTIRRGVALLRRIKMLPSKSTQADRDHTQVR